VIDMLTKQLVLKPQDLVVAIKLAIHQARDFRLLELADELYMAVSAIHGSIRRCEQARLVTRSDGTIRALRPSLKEFAIHGAKYAFPGQLGASTRGMPTAIGAPILASHFEKAESLSPVWPHALGAVWGPSLQPIHPSVPAAAARDVALYEILALLDALRVGAARERELAAKALNERFV
jgi:hypothetical protein